MGPDFWGRTAYLRYKIKYNVDLFTLISVHGIIFWVHIFEICLIIDHAFEITSVLYPAVEYRGYESNVSMPKLMTSLFILII